MEGTPVTSPVMMLAFVGGAAKDRIEAALAGEGLSLRYLGVLGHLSSSPGLSYSDLARRAGVTVQSMQATVAAMETAGFIARSGPGGRGRAASLGLTSRGRDALTSASSVIAAVEADFLAAVPPPARAALSAALAPLALSLLRGNEPGTRGVTSGASE